MKSELKHIFHLSKLKIHVPSGIFIVHARHLKSATIFLPNLRELEFGAFRVNIENQYSGIQIHVGP